MTNFEAGAVMSTQDFAVLGGGEVAYVKEISGRAASKIVRKAGGEMASFPARAKLFALHAADGTPIAITDTRESAEANAMENDLIPVALN